MSSFGLGVSVSCYLLMLVELFYEAVYWKSLRSNVEIDGV